MADAQKGPLTDEELDAIERQGETGRVVSYTCLVAEVRRLRSDEWLEAAAANVMTAWPSGVVTVYRDQAAFDAALADLLAILRKHRDER